MDGLRHLLILCCYGGVPHIDYGPAAAQSGGGSWQLSNTLDPTDWIAVDSSGGFWQFLRFFYVEVFRLSIYGQVQRGRLLVNKPGSLLAHVF